MTNEYRPFSSAEDEGFAVNITPESAGWGYSGLRILHLGAGESRTLATGDSEVMLVPLSGSCAVESGDEHAELVGRKSVFDGISDVAYIPRSSDLVISTDARGRFALASARCEKRLSFRHIRASEIPVELRGAGNCSRQVNNFGTPDTLEADRIIACEVLTPGGNWSSFPPHKHDEKLKNESILEEIYYFEVAQDGVAYQRVYGTQQRPIDVLAEVRTGDVVLIPHGWHGPSMAVPGYDLYYLNVMAGPGERTWLITDDPQYSWIRDTWSAQSVDPRLPLTEAEVRA